VQRLQSKLSDALCLRDDEGNVVTPLASLKAGMGVLASLSEPALAGELARLINTFLFGAEEQRLHLSSSACGHVALSAGSERAGSDVVYRVTGSHAYCARKDANELRVSQELSGMLKLQDLFRFVRNVSSIASDSADPVGEDELREALSELLPQLAGVLGGLVEEGSADFWLERCPEAGAVHVRIEALLDVRKVEAGPYKSVAETLRRAHSADLRVMRVPPGAPADRAALREEVRSKGLNDFEACMMLRLLSGKHLDGRAPRGGGNGAKGCLLRLDFAVAENGDDIVWVDPKTCLPALDEHGRCQPCHFDEDHAGFRGRCLLGFELTAGVSELGCATISMPRLIACLDYSAEEAEDGTGVAASVECTPLFIDWNRIIKLLARPLVDLSRMEKLLMTDFSFKVSVGPRASLDDTIRRHGVVPGYGLFPDLPAELDPWVMRTQLTAMLVRPAGVVLAFMRMYVQQQTDSMGELILARDLTAAFVADLQALSDACPSSGGAELS
jgi:hypothetical protein